MDATHLHLALAHFPIIGTIIGTALLAYGLIIKNFEIQKVAMITFVIMALLTIPVFLTGEEAEEAVEHLPGFSERLIDEHEELAEIAIWLMGALGVLGIIAYYAIRKKLSFAKIITVITFVLSLATFGIFAQAGNLGGQIRHSEIRTANNQAQKGNFGETKLKSYNKENDDNN